MKAYPEYNDSGVAWIGMIPKHWEVGKIRNLLSLSTEKTKSNGGDLLSLSQYTGVSRKADNDVGIRASEDTTGYNIVKKGQFVMNIMLAWNGSYAVSNYDGIISPAYCVFDFTKECSKSYYNYLLRLPVYAGAFKTESKGIIESRLRLYPQYFKNFPLLVPPLSEQRAMAAYLDRVTAEIDRAIGQQQRLIDLLTERKQIIIQRTVTRGLDPNATNVEWIPLRYVFEIRNGYTPSKKVSAYWTGGNIPWFRMEDIRKSGRILSDSIQHITSKAIKGKGLFKANSFILATTATIGEHALLIADSLANQRFTNLKICKSLSDRFDIKFLFYYMFVIGDWCKTSVNTTCFSSVDIGELKAQRIPLYSLSEQQAIAEYLDRATAKIDAAIARQQKMIDLLTERKQIIVSEVVTGRINVSNGEQINTAKV